jgi:predicted dehydrogenase
MHPQISSDVYIYSEAGPDLDNYMKLVESFNARKDNPTSWKFHVYSGADYLAKAVAEKKGDIAVLAGRNDRKIYDIKALHDAGFKVLSDKPLTIDSRGAATLAEITAGGEVLLDIMTERHEATSRIQKKLLENDAVFGGFAEQDEPVIFKESVHHLAKVVNGAPLVRPWWYFDVTKQGEGLVDVTTHLVDLAQWMTAGDATLNFEKDVKVLEARRWATEVPLASFATVTGLNAFPEALKKDVANDTLSLYCNGEFTYTVKGVKVKLVVVWNLQAPPGGGDTHRSFMVGKKSTLIIDQGPQTGNKPELYVEPKQNSDEFRNALTAALPGLPIIPEGKRYRIDIPQAMRTTHEEHFAKVRNEFLEMLTGDEPANVRTNLLAKYKTLAIAREMALAASR